ncbi:cupin-like domain-containing protein [Bradyrhizobium sp. SZCCHNR2035]|uniref:cupin-like domain-containing protein n=1 Tax=Bradyrhizobium sp. SZCCHNR2035 TaxID=3057386 RepID=UPI0029162772|nr:cupin-like domain-containing protein [Bradyrhizobium sp. SZCCHNR2035]
MTNSIERREKMSVEEFRREYSEPSRPVVLANLFDGQPLARLRTAELFAEKFGEMPIMTYEHYDDMNRRALVSLIMGGQQQAQETKPLEKMTTVREYMEEIGKNPKYLYLCSESPQKLWPAEFRSSFKFPEYCRDENGKLADLDPELWLGPGGYITHMHYDADGRDNLLHQVFGRKRFILAPPSSAKRIGSILNKGIFSPESLNESDRNDWISFIGGCEVVLEPGETLFIPALWWHYAEYLSTSFSIVIRHNRSDEIRAFYDHVQPNYKTQHIMHKFRYPERISNEWRQGLSRFEAVFNAPDVNPDDKRRKVHQLVDTVYNEMCSTEVGAPLLAPMISWGIANMEMMFTQVNNFQHLRYKGDGAVIEAASA